MSVSGPVGLFVGGVFTLGGLILLSRQLRSTVARRRWTRVPGRLIDTTYVRLRDDGSEVHKIRVTYPVAGTEMTTWSDREFGPTVARRIGTEVAVWYHPDRPASHEVAFSAEETVAPLEVVLAAAALLVGLLVVVTSL
jgi:hypothetical protein